MLYTADQLYAPGRLAINAKGNVWSSLNWLTGTTDPSTYVAVLDPVGQSTLGSPISGGGMKTGAWGIAIAPDKGMVWVPSYGGAAIAQYSAEGTPLSPSTGWKNGDPNHPQGIAVDQKGNVWIANNYGTETAPGLGDVIVYPGGDPSKAFTISGGGLNHPFAVQIDGYGRAWVTNEGPGGEQLVGTRAALLIGKAGGSITVIGTDFKPTSFSPIEDDSFKWPLGLAIDSQNNAWTVNAFGNSVMQIRPDGSVAGVFNLPRLSTPWSEAIDGSDRVWVANDGLSNRFGKNGVALLCGVNTSACPPGSATGAVLSPRKGFQSQAIEHLTAIQIDQSGNVWLANNNASLVPLVGGTGIAEIIGAATPVCAPLQPLPVKPSSTSATPCPQQVAAALPASLSGQSGSGTPTWVWIVVGVAAGVLVVAGAVVLLRRRRTG